MSQYTIYTMHNVCHNTQYTMSVTIHNTQYTMSVTIHNTQYTMCATIHNTQCMSCHATEITIWLKCFYNELNNILTARSWLLDGLGSFLSSCLIAISKIYNTQPLFLRLCATRVTTLCLKQPVCFAVYI